jgi:hypothetical protein
MTCAMLVATAEMSDIRLEPTDETDYIITIENKSRLFTAEHVSAQISIAPERAGSLDGVDFIPDDRSFGTIPPSGSESREFKITTERACKGSYRVSIRLKYRAFVDESNCLITDFCVSKD